MHDKFNNWTEKYRTNTFNGIFGQTNAIRMMKSFFISFPSDKKALILYGPSGTGKTSLAYVVQNEFNLEIFELNASDFRDREQLQAKLKPASEQKSLFKKGKVLLVDEIDGLTATERGGLPELLELIDNTQFPMIITANNIWNPKFGELRKKCKLVELKNLNYKDISLILQGISKKENLTIDNQVLVSISVRAKGDARAAINDLQAIATDRSLLANYLGLDERNKEVDIFNALKIIFKNMLTKDTLTIYDSVDMPLEKIFLWIEENIPYEYSGKELFNAYEILSIADLFRGRIQRQRHWRFLLYQNILLSAGIALSKQYPKTGFTKYQKPSRILKIWMNNEREKNKKDIVIKYARATHCSKRKTYREFHLIKNIIKNPDIQKKLNLSEQEINYIQKIK